MSILLHRKAIHFYLYITFPPGGDTANAVTDEEQSGRFVNRPYDSQLSNCIYTDFTPSSVNSSSTAKPFFWSIRMEAMWLA